MPAIDVVVSTEISRSSRARQLEGMFDVPPAKKTTLHFTGDLPIESREWNIGLITGPSGSGKSTISRHLWPEQCARLLSWSHQSVIDDFDDRLPMEKIAEACQSVGFNTIPAWLRPYGVLSTGEQFRAMLARILLTDDDPIVVDEFTSVVDRQVAKIGSYAVAKHIRKRGKRFVAVSCHSDIIEWLQPDWVYMPGTGEFHWRLLQRRPGIDCVISPVHRDSWRVFAPFHYLTSELNRSARCFVLFIDDTPAAFAGMLIRPGTDVMGCSRLVTLPDYQGLGLAFVLIERVASLYRAVGYHVHTYPAHPGLIHGFDRSQRWVLRKHPGDRNRRDEWGRMGTRHCAVFRYAGPTADRDEARRVFAYWGGARSISKSPS
jgi:ABC-type lipoprotein export system ATPase subunit